MTIDDIYEMLRLWYLTWLIFKVLQFVSVDSRRIASLLRGGNKDG